MERPPAGRLLASLVPLFAIQALFQILQVGGPSRWGWSMSWPNDLVWQAAIIVSLIALVAVIVLVVLALLSNDTGARTDIGPQVMSGFMPTASILPSVFALAVLVMVWGPDPSGRFPPGELLLSAAAIAGAAWTVFAVWRGRASSAKGVSPELFESLRSDYQAISHAQFPPGAQPATARSIPTGMPGSTDGPLPKDRIASYVEIIGQDLGLVSGAGPGISPRAWNTGAPYLEIQRKMAHVRDSLVAHEENADALQAHALTLELRLNGANMGDVKALLTPVLSGAKENITVRKDLLAQARSLHTIAATMSSLVYTKQKSLVRVMLQQHWLVVVVQLVTIVILSIAVLAGASDDAIGAGGLFYLIGAGSGILSLLHVRQSIAQPDLGEDYGLLRVELARAFTLSGLAAIIAVFLVANLPVIAQSSMFEMVSSTAEATTPQDATATEPSATPATIATATETPATGFATIGPAATVEAEGATPAAHLQPIVLSYGQPLAGIVFAQETDPTATPTPPSPDNDEDGDQVTWRPLGSVFSFGNLAGLLIALVAGWIPERLFRSLTSYGNRLRYDIQSMSQAGG